jgi:hypothetical protein
VAAARGPSPTGELLLVGLRPGSRLLVGVAAGALSGWTRPRGGAKGLAFFWPWSARSGPADGGTASPRTGGGRGLGLDGVPVADVVSARTETPGPRLGERARPSASWGSRSRSLASRAATRPRSRVSSTAANTTPKGSSRANSRSRSSTNSVSTRQIQASDSCLLAVEHCPVEPAEAGSGRFRRRPVVAKPRQLRRAAGRLSPISPIGDAAARSPAGSAQVDPWDHGPGALRPVQRLGQLLPLTPPHTATSDRLG